VVADPHQLEQVFLNVINNALDAMLESHSSGVLKVRGFRKNNFVCVEFDDSGPGIKDPTRIFDRSTTTKTIGKGTGLGLSICYGIIKEHGGEMLRVTGTRVVRQSKSDCLPARNNKYPKGRERRHAGSRC